MIFIFVILALLFPSRTLATDYRIGVNYHALTKDMDNTAFLTTYQNPTVRSTVITQLRQMAKTGVQMINTQMWITDPSDVRQPNQTPRFGFPPSNQEMLNLRQYIQDVSVITTNYNKPLDLYLTLRWNGCGDFREGYDMWCHMTWPQYITNVKATIDIFFDTISDVTRPDGKKVVQLAYFDGEVMVPAKKNEDKMLLEGYSYFVKVARDHGIEPSIYFNVESSSKIFSEWTDPEFPAINNHISLFQTYRTIDFMRKNNLYIPHRLDISMYPGDDPLDATKLESLVKRVMSDLKEVFPDNTIGIAETMYCLNPGLRRAFASAYAEANVTYGRPEELLIWSTPDGCTTVNGGVGFPFEVNSYYKNPKSIPNPSYLSVTNQTITWTPGSGNLPQYLQVSTDQGVIFKSEKLDPGTNIFTIPTPLNPNTTYYWKISNSEISTPQDSIVEIKTPANYNNPRNLVVAGQTIAWTPGYGNRPQYLYVGTSQDAVNNDCNTSTCLFKSGELDPTLGMYTINPTVVPNTTYYWRIANKSGTTMYD